MVCAILALIAAGCFRIHGCNSYIPSIERQTP
jgi:hypothetical protein